MVADPHQMLFHLAANPVPCQRSTVMALEAPAALTVIGKLSRTGLPGNLFSVLR